MYQILSADLKSNSWLWFEEKFMKKLYWCRDFLIFLSIKESLTEAIRNSKINSIQILWFRHFPFDFLIENYLNKMLQLSEDLGVNINNSETGLQNSQTSNIPESTLVWPYFNQQLFKKMNFSLSIWAVWVQCDSF